MSVESISNAEIINAIDAEEETDHLSEADKDAVVEFLDKLKNYTDGLVCIRYLDADFNLVGGPDTAEFIEIVIANQSVRLCLTPIKKIQTGLDATGNPIFLRVEDFVATLKLPAALIQIPEGAFTDPSRPTPEEASFFVNTTYSESVAGQGYFYNRPVDALEDFETAGTTEDPDFIYISNGPAQGVYQTDCPSTTGFDLVKNNLTANDNEEFAGIMQYQRQIKGLSPEYLCQGVITRRELDSGNANITLSNLTELQAAVNIDPIKIGEVMLYNPITGARPDVKALVHVSGLNKLAAEFSYRIFFQVAGDENGLTGGGIGGQNQSIIWDSESAPTNKEEIISFSLYGRPMEAGFNRITLWVDFTFATSFTAGQININNYQLQAGLPMLIQTVSGCTPQI